MLLRRCIRAASPTPWAKSSQTSRRPCRSWTSPTCRRSLRKATLTSWFTKTPKDPISAASTRRSGLPKSPKCYRAAKSRKPHSHKPVSYWTNNRYVGTRSFSRIERSDRRYSRSVNTFTKLIALSRKRVRTLPTCRAGQWISRRNLQCRHFAIGNPSVTGCHILYGNSRSAKSAANPSIRRRQTKIYRHTPFFYASVKSFSQRVRLMNRRVVKTDRICKKRN